MQDKMQEKSLIKKNILYFLDKKSITKYKFYQITGITRGVLDQDTGMSEENTARFIASFPEVNSHWLITGNGPMIKDTDESASLANDKEVVYEKGCKGIPLVPIDAFAGLRNGEIKVMDYECEKYYIPGCEKCDFLMPVKGDSMVPRYGSGDIVGCKMVPLKDIFSQWNKVYVLDTSQGALIKRVKKGSDDGHILLVSDNESYGPFELPLDKINAIALVLCLIKHE